MGLDTTHPPTTTNFYATSRHARRLRFGSGLIVCFDFIFDIVVVNDIVVVLNVVADHIILSCGQ